MQLNQPLIRLLNRFFLILGLAVLAVVGIINVFTAEPTIVLAIIAGVFITLVFSFSGNPRLFFLWAVILTAPLSLDMSFMIVPHMGGAGAFTIDFTDFFLFPLVIFLLQDYTHGYRPHIRLSGVTLFWGGMILMSLYDF